MFSSCKSHESVDEAPRTAAVGKGSCVLWLFLISEVSTKESAT